MTAGRTGADVVGARPRPSAPEALSERDTMTEKTSIEARTPEGLPDVLRLSLIHI